MSADVRHYKRFDWLVVPARDVVVGDLIANFSTVTEVIKTARKADREFDSVKRGQTLIRCGDSWASKGGSGRAIVVGRNFTPAAPSPSL